MSGGEPASRPRALVALNPQAHQGAAAARFEGVRPRLEQALDLRLVQTTPDRAWESAVSEALADGIRVFVAAGGDGTVHALVGALVRARGDEPLDDVVVGAIGLGSSNDFHKPVLAELAGLPVHLDLAHPEPRDVMLARWSDAAGVEREDVIVVSGSIGVTAAGNARFNRARGLLALLQRISTAAAILWAALATILAWRDIQARIRVDGEEISVGLTNLSVLETEWLSGGLHYDLPANRGDGRFVVALAHDRGLPARLGLLIALSRGRFAGQRGTRWWSAEHATIGLARPALLEIDGEVFEARSVRVSVHPHSLPVCAPGGPHV